ncbi:hypothetical protein KIN20_031431 [Parelaphostrongylus tenuis]|uniref:Uncharacterized protein n=1 Tax=Parelaphostrongylus tenuis TaxID=148309 RepID=A0AAD5R547_PARTN|nr:hypothetical protein KIN20_031431 [Parelaphostrongylus tenuis]
MWSLESMVPPRPDRTTDALRATMRMVMTTVMVAAVVSAVVAVIQSPRLNRLTPPTQPFTSIGHWMSAIDRGQNVERGEWPSTLCPCLPVLSYNNHSLAIAVLNVTLAVARVKPSSTLTLANSQQRTPYGTSQPECPRDCKESRSTSILRRSRRR